VKSICVVQISADGAADDGKICLEAGFEAYAASPIRGLSDWEVSQAQ